MKILFILKDRLYHKHNSNSYGLINSARQVADYLETLGHKCKIKTVIDANYIDKEIHEFNPNLVIIEALWVSGDKLKELIEIKRYKDIDWVVRIHSNIGFLSAETMALKYINDYIRLDKKNLYISFNNEDLNHHIKNVLCYDFLCLPNIITIKNGHMRDYEIEESNYINIGCFGALRLLKNQCYQAICAIEATNRLKKKLKFHITVDVDTASVNSILVNLEQLFENSEHKLIKHFWMDNDKFHNLIKEMDIGMQLSFTESFNIVAADFINHNKLIVVSEAIPWLPKSLQASTVTYAETIKTIVKTYNQRNDVPLKKCCKNKLISYNKKAQEHWNKFIEKL